MAYYNNVEDKEQDDASQGMNQTAQQSPTQPVQLSGQSSTIGSAPGSTPKPANTSPGKPASSGSAPSFQNFAKANQGKAQESLNSAAAQNVTNQSQMASSSINQANTQFGQRVDQGSLANRQNALTDVQNTVQSARNIAAGNAVDQTQQDRFKEVINAKYQGPESLRQSGLYNKASQAVGTAQTSLDNTKTALGREDLLRNMYQDKGNYTSGLNKLDSALINSSQQGISNLQNAAAQQGNLGQKLDKAQIGSINASQNRSNEINQIKQQARDAFSTGKTDEEKATDIRLSKVVEDWEILPEFYRNIIRQSAGGPTNFSTFEAASLGLNSGEGLYNLGADAIKSAQHDKTRLISKDEQARQAALSQLAGLDMSNQLDTNLLYGDADRAGTQSALDALDLKATREGLNAAEQQFRDTARATDLMGEGFKKVSRGNAFGKKTKTYTANVGGNVGNFLEQAGYNLDSQNGAGQNVAASNDLLKAALAASSYGRNNADAEDNQKVIESTGKGAAAGASTGAAFGPKGAAIGAIIGAGAGSIVGAGTGDSLQMYSDLLRGMGGPGAAVGKGIQDVRSAKGDAAEDILKINPFDNIGSKLGLGSLSSGISGAIRGIDSGAMKRYGSAVAQEKAIQDLQNKYSGFLDSQGFQNRANVVDNQQTTSRFSALQDILASMDKSNT
jgi:hypothetical protein